MNSLDPFDLFQKWFDEAQISEPEYPDAMSLATIGADGFPHVRIVLLKDFSDQGFVFYTNLKSHKGEQLLHCPHVALCFHWKSLKKQVRIEGVVSPVSSEEADQYFSSRARLSQIGAWASKQSEVMSEKFELEKRVIEFTKQFGFGEVPRPEFWSGFRVRPNQIEFWHEKPFRLHDRDIYIRVDESTWKRESLYP